jgi:hypothetical protein
MGQFLTWQLLGFVNSVWSGTCTCKITMQCCSLRVSAAGLLAYPMNWSGIYPNNSNPVIQVTTPEAKCAGENEHFFSSVNSCRHISFWTLPGLNAEHQSSYLSLQHEGCTKVEECTLFWNLVQKSLHYVPTNSFSSSSDLTHFSFVLFAIVVPGQRWALYHMKNLSCLEEEGIYGFFFYQIKFCIVGLFCSLYWYYTNKYHLFALLFPVWRQVPTHKLSFF